MKQNEYTKEALALLKKLIATPSVSRNEKEAADIMEAAIKSYGVTCGRKGNNVWSIEPNFDQTKPTLLLNAHIDTVRPVDSWTRNPYTPSIEGDTLYGLGSNDCGGGLVSLLQVFRHFIENKTEKEYNLIYLASCEEEVSGKEGISSALPELPKIDVAIVGEPTGMTNIEAVKSVYDDILVEQAAGVSSPKEVYDFIYAGCEATGAASGIFKAPDPKKMAEDMIAAVRRAIDDRKAQGLD